MKKIIFFLLFVTSTFANAAIVSLTCISVEDSKFTIGMDFDEQNKTVVWNGRKINFAVIDSTSIDFRQTLNSIDYFHTLNRSSGLMMVQRTDNHVVVDTFRCNLRRNKF